MGRPEARARLTPRLKPGACAAISVTRSAAGAVAALCALLLVLPELAHLLPAPWSNRLSAVLPTTLAVEMAGSGSGAGLARPAATAVLFGYAVLAQSAALLAWMRRDA